MTNQKPGIFRRMFDFIASLLTGIRHMFTLFALGFIVLLITGMFADDIQPVPEKAALYLAPSGVLVDQLTYADPIEQILSQTNTQNPETLVRDIIHVLAAASEDSRITHLLLDTDYLLSADIGKLEEIGTALMQFKQSGKPIIAVGDNFSQSQYFLAAHADEILMNPLGAVAITGFAAYGSYFKEALDKLKINVHIFRTGVYKSAVEPFQGNEMSPEVRQETRILVDSLWQFYSSRIEQLRNLPHGALDDFANNMHRKLQAANGDTSALAKQQGLVDQIASRTEIIDYLNQVLPGTEGEFDSIDFMTYLDHIELEASRFPSDNHKVAVVTAKGSIVDGEQPEGSVGGDTLAGILSEVRDDPEVKAVVLRIDSPGGSAFASDIIRDALAATRKQGTPVVVSMGGYAASGGYWIASEADKILALSTSITGSIGVFSIIPTVEDTLTSLGIHSDGVGTTAIADIMYLDRPMSERAEAIFQSSVENIYSRFITLVAEARQLKPETVHEIAQGRVWTGEQALALGLVDQLGDLNDAIATAAKLAELDHYQVDYRRKTLTTYEQLLLAISGGVGASLAGLGLSIDSHWLPEGLRQSAKSLLTSFRQLDHFNDPRGLYLYCAQCPL